MEAASIIELTDGAAGRAPAQLPAMWGAVAGGWAEHAAYVDARGARRHGGRCSS